MCASSSKALVDGPAKDPKLAVPRQPISFAKTLISPLVIETLPRGARTGTVRAAWEKADIDAKWAESAWAKSAARSARRKALTDFDRFKLMRLKKRARHAVRVQLAKTK